MPWKSVEVLQNAPVEFASSAAVYPGSPHLSHTPQSLGKANGRAEVYIDASS
jgi:hypothetical protein